MSNNNIGLPFAKIEKKMPLLQYGCENGTV